MFATGLKEEQEACQLLLERLSLRFTEPSEEEGWWPTHKYTLRGVATALDTVYLCQRAEPDLIELDGGSSAQDQWWKLAYIPKEANPLQVEVISSSRIRS